MYQMLKRPPYQNWFWRRRGIDGDGFSGNPADLSPVESYNEDGWDAKKWHDNLRVTREWDDGVPDVDFTMITKNSLDCMESNGNANLFHTVGADADNPFSQLSNGDASFYVVFRWDGTINDTLFWKYALSPAGAIFRVKVEGTSKLYVQMSDGTNSMFSILPNALTANEWHVLGVTYKNQTNDGELVMYLDQETPVSVTDASWDITQFIGNGGLSRLYSNNTLTERWDGALAEISIHQTQHTQAEAQLVNGWLANKWGIV